MDPYPLEVLLKPVSKRIGQSSDRLASPALRISRRFHFDINIFAVFDPMRLRDNIDGDIFRSRVKMASYDLCDLVRRIV